MKNITKLFLSLMFVGIVFSGCNEAEEILDVKFPANYETELDITVVPGTRSANGIFNMTETIDPTSNTDFDQYISTIKDIDITEVSGLVIEINPDITLVNANLTVSNSSHSATWTFTNKQLTQGATLTLGNETGEWDKVETILMDKTVFTVSMTGETDQDNAEFTILVSIKSNITANPLN